MLIQLVTFNLKNLSDAEYRTMCDGLAPALAEMPGLLAKVWLANEPSNTYGGIYTWADEAAMEAFFQTAFFKAFASNPSFVNIASTTFGTLEGPSYVTRARIAVAA